MDILLIHLWFTESSFDNKIILQKKGSNTLDDSYVPVVYLDHSGKTMIVVKAAQVLPECQALFSLFMCIGIFALHSNYIR